MQASSQKVEFPNDRGELLAGRLELPPGTPRAFAVFAHCFTCGKDVAAAGRISRALAQRDIAVLRFDFTGLGSSEGDFANTSFSSNVDDLTAAAEWLRREHRAPSLLVGHSLGGAAVLVAASRLDGIKAVATIGAPSDPGHVTHLLTDDLEQIRARGSARVQLAGREFTIKQQFLDDLDGQRMQPLLKALRPAVLIMHSPVDEVVSVDHARRLYASVGHPKSFLSLDDADHLLSRKADSEYVATLLAAWAERYLDPAPETEQPPHGGRIRVEGRGQAFAQVVTAGEHRLVADEPLSVGGMDSGPTPYDLLLAALGTCTSMTLGMYARRKRWPLERITVELEHSRIHAEDCAECETTTGSVDRIDKRIEVTGDLDDEQVQRLLEIADRCPVHKTLMGEKQVATTIERGTA